MCGRSTMATLLAILLANGSAIVFLRGDMPTVHHPMCFFEVPSGILLAMSTTPHAHAVRVLDAANQQTKHPLFQQPIFNPSVVRMACMACQ